MKIAIVGPGAMGRLFASFFARGGHVPVMVSRRDEQVLAFEKEGLALVQLDGVEESIRVDAFLQTEIPQDIDGILLTVKSYDTRAAGEMVKRYPRVPILSLQNGLGNGETLCACIDPDRLALGLTTHGATAEGDAKVHYKGRGNTIIGNWNTDSAGDPTRFGNRQTQSASDPARFWCDLLNSCGHEATRTDDIRTEVWRKAMVNIGINPFTALHNLRNGELLERPDLLAEMEVAVAEAEQVARAEGVALHESYARVLDVCRNTAGNQSSMLQDVLKARKTEIDSLCGVIVRLGDKHGIPTPLNSRLLQEISTIR